MKYIDQEKVNWAIHDCLERCYKTDEVLAVLAEFLDELKERKDWREAEIREVELGVLKVLHGVVEETIYAGDATSMPTRTHSPPDSKLNKVHGA